MEETCHVLKRKKRKTRRCLNEIRKKSRSLTNNAIKNSELGNKMNTVSKNIGHPSHNNFITTNRLTLAIFPKVVRSETITRPLLAEIRHEPGKININNIVRSKYVLCPESTANEKVVEIVEKHANNVHNNSVNLFSDDDDSGNSEKENCIKSIILAMDRDSDTSKDCDNGVAEEPSPPLASAGSATPLLPAPQTREEYAYRKYRQIIKEIPMYVQMLAPSLLTEDPMRKPKAMLQNMYLDQRRRLESAQESPTRNLHEPIPENPIDYLKRCTSIPSLVSLASPALPSQSPSLTGSPSPVPPCSPQEPPSIIQDTPEYTFFPHKLNQ